MDDMTDTELYMMDAAAVYGTRLLSGSKDAAGWLHDIRVVERK